MKNVVLSYSNSPVCEYLGSHIFNICGVPTHNTTLAIRDSKVVVLCEDFVYDNLTLYEFSKIKISFEPAFYNKDGEETDGMGSSLSEALLVLSQHPLFNKVPKASFQFWRMFIIDAIIGNLDRNNGNWGVIVNKETGDVSFAPIYDNGNCLNDKWDDDKMKKFLEDKFLFLNEAYKGKTCYFTSDDGKKINPFQLIASGIYYECTVALKEVLDVFDLEKVKTLIDDLELLNDTQRVYYYYSIIRERVKFLKEALDSVKNVNELCTF